MSDNNLKISLNTKTIFEFELDVKGIEVESADTRFGLEKNGICFQFSCVKKDETWSVDIPALDTFGLSEGLYKYTIEVIADGYYFAPVKGTAEVAASAEVKGSLVKKDVKVAVTAIKPKEEKKEKKSKKKEEKKEVEVKVVETTTKRKSKKKEEINEESIVDHMINRRFKPFEKRSIFAQVTDTDDVEEVEPISDQERAVKDILKDLDKKDG